jgi:hypothetical protein
MLSRFEQMYRPLDFFPVMTIKTEIEINININSN